DRSCTTQPHSHFERGIPNLGSAAPIYVTSSHPDKTQVTRVHQHDKMSVAPMLLPELIAVHDRFLSLTSIAREYFGDSPGGKLLLRSGFDTEGIAAVIATTVAGAASL